VSQGRYPGAMDFSRILAQIDTELEKLNRIREVVLSLAPQEKAKRAKRSKAPLTVSTEPEVAVQVPQVVVLPTHRKREYRRRSTRPVAESRALAAPITEGPVFVSKAVMDAKSLSKAQPERDLSFVFRKRLLGETVAAANVTVN